MKLPADVTAALRSARVIAVVGLSSHPVRPSFGVARYLQSHGFRILPVNPHETTVLGEAAYADLDSASAAAPIDVVDVFRRSEFVPEVAAAAIRIGAKMLWLQEGVSHPAAEAAARTAGLLVVADRCLLKEHARLPRGGN